MPLLLRLSLYWIGLDEVPHSPYYGITQGNIGFVSNGLKYGFLVRGNADCHDPVAAFRHRGRLEVTHEDAIIIFGLGRSAT